MTTPLTKTARHARIADILAREQVRSQEELADLLERYAGVHVPQATLSRDLALFSEQGWALSSLRAFDAFPMTQHVELLATLIRG